MIRTMFSQHQSLQYKLPLILVLSPFNLKYNPIYGKNAWFTEKKFSVSILHGVSLKIEIQKLFFASDAKKTSDRLRKIINLRKHQRKEISEFTRKIGKPKLLGPVWID